MTNQSIADHPLGIPVFVAHVKKGYEDRGVHIEQMLGRMGVDFIYMLDGDIPDLTPEIIETYFAGELSKPLSYNLLRYEAPAYHGKDHQ